MTTTERIWRGDPVDRRGQEIAAAELREAYDANREIARLAIEYQAIGRKINGLRTKRDASIGMIHELRFSLKEAAGCLRASDEEFKEVDLTDFVEAMNRVDSRRCSKCQSLTFDYQRETGDRTVWKPCERHAPDPDRVQLPTISIEEGLVLSILLRPAATTSQIVVERWDEIIESLRERLGPNLPTISI